MKIRNGFVSNSSSASFVVPKEELNDLQLGIVRNYTAAVNMLCNLPDVKFDYANCVCDWDMVETDNEFQFDTIIDNFYLEEFFRALNIPVKDYRS